MSAVPHYKAIPALAAYIDRIGADEINFRTFMIREWHGQYYKEVAKIRLDELGNVTVTAKAFAPTKEEAEAIKLEVPKATWPRHIYARDTSDLPKRSGSAYFEFISREDNLIIMVQERTANKEFYPWTYWNDKQWRRMEPDEGLPLWKPRKKRCNYIMIHEGAKAAEAVEKLLADQNARHPWRDRLSEYEHWGMIGGALAPERTDWTQLKREKPLEVVYVCDNDYPGKSVLQIVSRLYRGKMTGLKFTENFPISFDLADPFPESMFSESGRYLGPEFDELLTPATWATDAIEVAEGEKKTKTVYRIAPDFEKEWYHSVSPSLYIHRGSPNQLLNSDSFNSLVAPFSNVDDTARLLRKRGANKSVSIGYNPGLPPGIQESDSTGAFFNTHVGSRYKPEPGDVSQWLEFMAHLIPGEADREHALKWIATLLARPGTKMLYGMLLISETQGVGKSTLTDAVLKPLIGHHNVGYPSERDFVDSNFTYWASHKRLAVIHEIYAGHSSKAYNGLKTYITDETIRVKRKFIDDYDIENWIHFVACSNSLRALKITHEDRRWLVPELTEVKRSEAYWSAFHTWLRDGGLSRILNWADEYVARHGQVRKGEEAPETSLKREVIEENLSPGQQKVLALLRDLKDRFVDNRPEGEVPRKLYLLDRALVRYVSEELYGGKTPDFLEKPSTLRKLAKNNGWWVHPVKFWWPNEGKVYLICSAREDIERDPKELMAHYTDIHALKVMIDAGIEADLRAAGRSAPTEFEINDQPPPKSNSH